MKEVLSVVAAVRRRVFVNLLLAHLFDAAFWAAALLALVTLGAKIVFFPNAVFYIGWACLAAGCAAVAYAAIAARIELFPAAVAADEGLGLAERLSTALLVVGDGTPMAMAVVGDARMHAARVRPSERFPVRLPSRWWRFTAALIVFVGLLTMPQFDAFGRQARFVKTQKDKGAVAKQIRDIKKQIERLRKAFEGKEFAAAGELDALEAKLVEMEKLGLSRKQALAAISEPLDRLAERMKEAAKDLAKNSDQSKAELLSAMSKQEQGLAGEQSALMKQSDALKEAMENLEQMAADMNKSGEMSSEKAQQLAKALEELAKTLPQDSKTAEAMKSAAQQLAKAADAAQNGDQQQAAQNMQKALTGLQSQLGQIQSQMALTQQQMQGLQQQMAALQQQMSGQNGSQMSAADALQQIQAMSDAMQGMQSFKSDSSGMGSMTLAEAMQQLEQAQASWKEGMGAGQGEGEGEGGGMGGPGRGRGNQWDVAPDVADPSMADSIPGEMKPGRVLASYFTQGGQIKNESKVQWEDVALESKQRAKDALTEQKIPRTHEKVVREYFDSLENP